MIPCQNRLTDQKDFEAVHRSGKFFSLDIFSLKVRKNSLDRTRIGISVGLKFSKKAVERNKIKRQIREIVENYLPDGIQKGLDIVIMPRKAKEKKINFLELNKNIENIFKKANLL